MDSLMRSLLFVVIALLVLRSPGFAQLSPGDLSQAHAKLEGLDNCTRCHEKDRRLGPELCVVCHVSIKAQHDKKHSLHSRADFRECQLCHVEHQGRDFRLIHWKDSMTKFDHTTTGYTLDGKHLGLDCRKCHTASMIKNLNKSDTTVNMKTTFLGLDTSCASCHFDEHRTQLGNNCVSCHATSGWKPAAKFNHDSSTFALAGKHQQADCVKCHKTIVPTGARTVSDTSYQQFTNIAHNACTDCHTDVHKGTLGANCESCHSPNGWHNLTGTKFDHSKTRYPLVGKHAEVACEKCHTAKTGRTDLKFALCTDCHTDFHTGAFAKRAKKGQCEECHTVRGFSPTNFTVTQHEKTDYPLRGAHLAIPCITCHLGEDTTGARTSQFVFSKFTCAYCHRDQHNGEVKTLVDKSGCETCHSIDGWSNVKFDHKQTKFALEGKHSSTPCIQCHSKPTPKGATPILTMIGAKTLCNDCHNDVHRGQFASEKKVADCKSCHQPLDWHMTTFDHNKASEFHLDGAHKTVACVKCHTPITDKNGTWVRYKPLDSKCASCHGKEMKSERIAPW
jgi:Cytochrome c7 and related cytochrome c